nr:hypothetical protein Iba_chr01bCG11890 [Ipomoea batatas]
MAKNLQLRSLPPSLPETQPEACETPTSLLRREGKLRYAIDHPRNFIFPDWLKVLHSLETKEMKNRNLSHLSPIVSIWRKRNFQAVRQNTAEPPPNPHAPCLPLIPITGHENVDFQDLSATPPQPRGNLVDNSDHSYNGSQQQVHIHNDNINSDNTANSSTSPEPLDNLIPQSIVDSPQATEHSEGEVEADDGGGKDVIVLTVAEDVEVAAGTVRHRQRMSAFLEEPRREGRKGWSGSWRRKRERTEISQLEWRSASAAK